MVRCAYIYRKGGEYLGMPEPRHCVVPAGVCKCMCVWQRVSEWGVTNWVRDAHPYTQSDACSRILAYTMKTPARTHTHTLKITPSLSTLNLFISVHSDKKKSCALQYDFASLTRFLSLTRTHAHIYFSFYLSCWHYLWPDPQHHPHAQLPGVFGVRNDECLRMRPVHRHKARSPPSSIFSCGWMRCVCVCVCVFLCVCVNPSHIQMHVSARASVPMLPWYR
jgi:hypothetical protein